MATMTHTKFYFNQLIVTLVFGIWASEPPSPEGQEGQVNNWKGKA